MRSLQLVGVLVLFLAMSLSSCECRKEPPPITQTAAVEPTQPPPPKRTRRIKPTATPATAAAEPTAETPAELPADFPSEIPVYEGSTLMRVHPMANEAHNVIFSAQDSVSNVRDFYYKKLQSQGFEVKQEFMRDKQAFATFKKGDLLVNVTVAEDERSPGQQIIAIMYEREKDLPFKEF